MTPVEKVRETEQRIRAVVAGTSDLLVCVFCGQQNAVGQMLCCEPLAEMVNAICDHIELKDQLKAVERVMDRLNSNRYEITKGPRLILN